MDSNSSSSSSSNNNNDELPHQDPELIMESSDSTDRYPTIFVKADTSSFKEIVQKLTGCTETTEYSSFEATPSNSRNNIPPIQTMPEKHQSKLNLHERRNSQSNLLPLFPSDPSTFAPNLKIPDINLSPSDIDFTALSLGPVTPHIPGQSANPNSITKVEENASKEKDQNTSNPRDAESAASIPHNFSLSFG